MVETPGGEVVLVDCGGEGTGRTLSEFLRREGHRTLALLVITEDSPDALGGAAELVERIPVRRAVLPRAAAPSSLLRAVMAALSRRATPYELGPATGAFSGPGDLRWTLWGDLPEGGEWPRSGSEALGVRVQWSGASALFAPVRSRASVRRLLMHADEYLRCDVLRLYGNATGSWPEEAAALVRRSEASTLVAGEGTMLPDEGTGLDLAALARSRGLRLLSPHREGSLRFGADRMDQALAYRQGAWKELGP
jgi:beta-lactamase superfamily II metal-dependent hydrolase